MTRSRDLSASQSNLGGAIPPFAAGKNAVINGNFGVWQRGTTFSPTSAAVMYTADRFFIYNNGSGVVTASQQTFTPGAAPVAGYEGSFFHRIATAASLGTTTQISFNQRIEDVRVFAGQTVTLSFWAKLGTAQNAVSSIQLQQNFGSGGSATVNTSLTAPTLSTSWARYSMSVAVPSISGKTIGTSSYLNLAITFAALISQTLDIWGVQLEAGSTATPFQTATGTIQGELAACQRYYWRFDLQSVNNFGFGYAGATTNGIFVIPFPVALRTAATALEQSGNTTDYTVTNALANNATTAVPAFATGSKYNCTINCATTALTVGEGVRLRGATTNAYLAWSAEL